MASSLSAQNDNNTTYFDHITCNICLEVLQEPVQCVNNEHYFCKKCISEHLTRSQTCPTCRDELTTDTLRPVSRVVRNLLQQLQYTRCMYASRGCKSAVKHEDLLSHHEDCGFAPVQCSHDGCEVTVNKQDLGSHQENCEFRSVTCEECLEAMKKRDYRKHDCVLRKEMDEFKRGLAEVWKVLREIQDEQTRQGEEMRQMARELRQSSVAEGQAAGEAKQSDDSRKPETELHQPESQASLTSRAEINDNVPTGSCVASNDVETPITPHQIQRRVPVDKEIFVASGSKKRSCEIFNWSTQKWSLHQDMLFFDHTDGFSFVYEKVDEVQFYELIMICGGPETNRIECLNVSDCKSVSAYPAQLPSTPRELPRSKCDKGALCNDEILTFGYSVFGTSLKPRFRFTKHLAYDNGVRRSNYGVACVNKNAVVVVGGISKCYRDKKGDLIFYPKTEKNNSVLLYNPIRKTMKTLAPLPYKLHDMAVVAHEDNVIILGGLKGKDEYEEEWTNDVFMYNITNQHCLRLPSMLEKR